MVAMDLLRDQFLVVFKESRVPAQCLAFWRDKPKTHPHQWIIKWGKQLAIVHNKTIKRNAQSNEWLILMLSTNFNVSHDINYGDRYNSILLSQWNYDRAIANDDDEDC